MIVPVPSRDVVICNPVRTPIGRFNGRLKTLSAADLAAHTLRALIDRGVPPGEVDDVILGQCYPNGEAPALGRVAALDAGLPVTVPGVQVDRRCGSGLYAIVQAVLQVASASCDLVLAGGAESMSNVEFYSLADRSAGSPTSANTHDRLARARVTAGGRNHPVPGGMLETAENIRAQYSIPRAEQDALALESHRRAVEAQDQGRFDQEIVAVELADGTVHAEDEGPRRGASWDKMAALAPVLDVDGATVTAGNASTQNDAAAACVVTTSERARTLGLDPVVRLVSWAVAGVEPRLMGLGPVPAVRRALSGVSLSLNDVGLVEVNEAFAAQVLGCTREWGWGATDLERLNVNGSGISLGHPVGATGARIAGTLAYEMRRRDVRFGLETMCIGGGQGMAAVFELVD